MELKDFANVFGILAMQLRATDADEATMRAYYHALKDHSLESVQGSAVALAKEPGRRFFPTTAEWSDAAREARTTVFRDHLLTAREEPWKLECERCDDTGWAISSCSGDDFCGRKHKHMPHDFAKICPCRPTNRTWQRHQHVGRGASA